MTTQMVEGVASNLARSHRFRAEGALVVSQSVSHPTAVAGGFSAVAPLGTIASPILRKAFFRGFGSC